MEISDEELMGRYQKGDGKAFEELYSRYSNKMKQFIHTRLSTRQRNFSEDLFQAIWLKIHRARKNFDPSRRFAPWLFQIAINTLRDHLALKRFSDEVISDELEQLSDQGSNFEWRLDFEKVLIHLDRLPHLQKEVLLLAELSGFSSLEIGEILNLKSENIRQILFRARKSIREALEESA